MADAGQKLVAAEPGMIAPRPAMAARGAAEGMTPREMLAILRRHWLMIFLLTILGFGIGVASWFLFSVYGPEYTAQTFIKVLPPVRERSYCDARHYCHRGHPIRLSAVDGHAIDEPEYVPTTR